MRGLFEIRRTITLIGVVALLLPAAYAFAQVCTTPTTPTFDNRDGYLPPFEEQPVRPMALSSTGDELWVINLPDARVSVFDATNPTGAGGPALLDEIGVGLGPVTIVPRPGTTPAEMWVVCTSSNSVFVIDEASRQVRTTIRLTHEPNDLVFDATGATAYVTLGATNEIAVIDATPTTGPAEVLPRIQFESFLPTIGTTRLHAEEPLTLMLEGSDLFAVSHLSGNGTVSNRPACGSPPLTQCFQGSGVPFLAQLWTTYNLNPLLPEPPDRDIFRFDINAPAAAGTVVGWRFGTINFDLQREPATQELVVSNVDLRNDSILTEQLYPLDTIELGKPAIHRLSWGPEATAAISNQSVKHFDLNAAANIHNALVTLDYACSFPNQMAFNALGDTLYVSCYGTNNVAVLDWPPTQVQAELRSGATVTNKTGFGTHGLVLDEARGVVYTYEQGDGSLQVYADNPTPGTVNAPLRTVSLGFDITPANIESGRFHFNNVKNSSLRTESCATCHYRGHFDAIAWDLSDVSGDLPTQLGQPLPPTNRGILRDFKLVKVTMSLRGIEETPPFHWRGDRDDLQAFGGSQVALLGGMELSAEALQEIDDFIFSLSYRPNPDQLFARDYSAAALTGLSCFTHDATLSFLDDTTGAQLTVPCESCHGLAGASGTNNQVNSDSGILLVPMDATQLRGLFDKESDQLVDSIGVTGATTPVSGWGFANFGAFDTVAAFTDVAAGALSPQVQDFFREFDSGMAPTTAYAWTMDQQSVAAIPGDAVTLFASADAGHNDIMVRGLLDLGGGFQPIGMLYEPNGVPLGGLFRSDIAGFGPFTAGQLINAAQLGIGIWHFVGTPVGMGYRLGIDREMDFRLDGDEQATCPAGLVDCSSFRTADTDGDLYPDGYEVNQLTDPNDATVFPTNDNAAPSITNERVDWGNSSVAKVRWTTAGEESASRVRVFDSGNQLVAMTEELQYKTEHSLVVRGLTPGQTYTVEVESEDPANLNLPFLPPNRTQSTIAPPLVMQPRLFQNVMHVEETNFSVRAISIPGGNFLIKVTFTIHDGATSAPLANAPLTVDFDWFEWLPGGAGAIVANPVSFSGTTNAQGRISTNFTTTVVLTTAPGVVEVINTNVVDNVGNRLLFQPESGLEGFGVKKSLP